MNGDNPDGNIQARPMRSVQRIEIRMKPSERLLLKTILLGYNMSIAELTKKLIRGWLEEERLKMINKDKDNEGDSSTGDNINLLDYANSFNEE